MLTAAILLSLSSVCPQEPGETGPSALDRIVTVVGAMEISLGDVRAEVNRIVPLNYFHGRLPVEQKKDVYLQALATLTEKALVQQDAIRRGLPVSEGEIRAQFREALKEAGAQFAEIAEEEFDRMVEEYRPKVRRRLLIDKNEARFEGTLQAPTEEQLRATYAEREDTLFTPEQARFLHILLKVPPSADAKEGFAIRSRGEELLGKLADGADFSELARANSEDIFAANGGDMGLVAKGSFQVGELNGSAFALADGETSGLLISMYGFHILRRVESVPGVPLSYEQAEEQLRVELSILMREAARSAWIQEMRGFFPVEELISLDDEAIEAGEEPATAAQR